MYHVAIKVNTLKGMPAKYMIIGSQTNNMTLDELDVWAAGNGTVYLFHTDKITTSDDGAISYIAEGEEPIMDSVYDEELEESMIKTLINLVTMTDQGGLDTANLSSSIKVTHRQLLSFLGTML